MRVCSRRELVWDDKQLRLHSIRGRVLAAIEPDREWPGMWRVRMPDGQLKWRYRRVVPVESGTEHDNWDQQLIDL